jgi:GNAT superfamily N-acetyltransferase
MIIRQYEESDYDSISDLISRFYSDSLNEYGLEFNPLTLHGVINNLKATSFVAAQGNFVVGVIAGSVVNEPASHKKMYQELAWFVHPDYRAWGGVRLLRHLEKWCAEEGISQIIMAAMHNSMFHKVDKFYRAAGYQPFETHYHKEILTHVPVHG